MVGVKSEKYKVLDLICDEACENIFILVGHSTQPTHLILFNRITNLFRQIKREDGKDICFPSFINGNNALAVTGNTLFSFNFENQKAKVIRSFDKAIYFPVMRDKDIILSIATVYAPEAKNKYQRRGLYSLNTETECLSRLLPGWLAYSIGRPIFYNSNKMSIDLIEPHLENLSSLELIKNKVNEELKNNFMFTFNFPDIINSKITTKELVSSRLLSSLDIPGELHSLSKNGNLSLFFSYSPNSRWILYDRISKSEIIQLSLGALSRLVISRDGKKVVTAEMISNELSLRFNDSTLSLDLDSYKVDINNLPLTILKEFDQ